MAERREYEMTQEQLDRLMEWMRPVPLLALQTGLPLDTQASANAGWAELSKDLNFDPMTPRPVPGKSERFFTAVPLESN